MGELTRWHSLIYPAARCSLRAAFSVLVAGALLLLAACDDDARTSLDDSPFRCHVALELEIARGYSNTGQSHENLNTFARHFPDRTDFDEPDDHVDAAAKIRAELSASPDLQAATARACVARAKRSLG